MKTMRTLFLAGVILLGGATQSWANCWNWLVDAVTGEYLFLEEEPSGWDYLWNTLYLPLGITHTALGIVAPLPVTILMPQGCFQPSDPYQKEEMQRLGEQNRRNLEELGRTINR